MTERKRTAYDARNYIHSKKDFPTVPHLSIIEFGSITIPGDERSQTNPGHGYPEHSVSKVDYVWYALEDEEFWKADILERMTSSSRKEFIAPKNGEVYEPKIGLV